MASEPTTPVVQKFRPSLSLAQIEHILNIYSQLPASPSSQDVLATLTPFYLKVKAGILSPSHTSAPARTLEQSLGFEECAPLGAPICGAWEKYKLAPHLCSEQEKEEALAHAYTNGLLDPAQEAAYEASLLGGHPHDES